MLALDLPAFDQDPAGGWRSLEARGCVAEAADLIHDWRAAHASRGPADALLSWHERQLRADAGQYAAAVTLLDAGRHPAADDAEWGWNLYVDGTVAFLRGDRRALEAARARLAALPRPPELKDAVGADGRPRTIRWPMNIGVLDNLVRCWGLSYKAAYRCVAPREEARADGGVQPQDPTAASTGDREATLGRAGRSGLRSTGVDRRDRPSN